MLMMLQKALVRIVHAGQGRALLPRTEVLGKGGCTTSGGSPLMQSPQHTTLQKSLFEPS
jgi:hypothetical protein